MNNFYDMEREGRAAYQLPDAGEIQPERQFFADEQEAGTLQGAVLSNPTAAVKALGPLEVIRIGCGDIGGNVEPDRIAANMAFSEWLDSRGDALAQPDSFQEWLNQTGDAI